MSGATQEASSALTLHVSPSTPPWFAASTAMLKYLAFYGEPLKCWWEDATMDVDSPDVIPPRRLQHSIRENRHLELAPDTVVVHASINGKVVGVAFWTPPKRLWRPETLGEFLYRKAIDVKDALEDWVVPPTWFRKDRVGEFYRVQGEHREKYLGRGYHNDTWYLKILAVHPEFQRQGIGTTLLEWGMEGARDGERVYLESSEAGMPLYLKKGFQILGEFRVGHHGEVVTPCMVWYPPAVNK
jgi:GNAT superfamily N-acetyltransferase